MTNTEEYGRMVNDDLRMIDWVPDGDIKLRLRTFKMEDGPDLLSSACLFARKFDATVDDDILDMLDASIEQGKPPAPVRPRVPAVVAIPQAAILVT